jgi:hypothetical protein
MRYCSGTVVVVVLLQYMIRGMAEVLVCCGNVVTVVLW